MSQSGWTIEVTNLSPNATEEDVRNFFAFCGAIEIIEIVSGGEYASTAYVTFKNPHAVDTALLLNGATIADQPICISRWGHHEEDPGYWYRSSWSTEDANNSSNPQGHTTFPSAGEAFSLAQDTIKAMASKGYILGKDALAKAKSFDESHQLSATAVSKISSVSDRIGLTDKIFYGVEAARSVNQRYHISDTTKSAVSSAANSVVNSQYVSRGALWLSGALSRASQVAGDLGSRVSS